MTQFGVRPRMSAARRRIDAAGYTFQALKAARDKEAGDRAPKRAARTDAATARPNADPNAHPNANGAGRARPSSDCPAMPADKAVSSTIAKRPPPASAPARAQWFWPCFQKGEAADIADAGDSLSGVLLAVSAHYGVSVTDLKSARRHKRLVMPRHVFCYLAATATRKSLPQIGAFLGDRDHTTVLHAVRKIKGLVKDGRLDPAALPKVR